MSPREIIQELFASDKALEVAASIARKGYFRNEPLLVVKEGAYHIVVEGNRRLAALKALQNPDLLEGPAARQVRRLSKIAEDDLGSLKVPVVIAPDRRATDRILAGRHIGTPVLQWPAESRANFVLEKLEEGYSAEELQAELGFTAGEVNAGRRVRAVADAARALDLPEDLKSKVASRRSPVFTTILRVLNSSVGRRYLQVELDPEHGFRARTNPEELKAALTRIVGDIAAGGETSRSLNSNEDMARYFGSWTEAELPSRRDDVVPLSSFEPATPQQSLPSPAPRPPRAPGVLSTVLPRDFKVLIQNDRLIEIRSELARLKRVDFPNAGAVLMRVFFELAVRNYLQRTGEMDGIIARLKAKNVLQAGSPTFAQLSPEITRIAKQRLTPAEAAEVEKAVTPNKSAPFTVSDLNSFVHNVESFPGDRDILTFWKRTQPLFKLMLQPQEDK